MAIIINTESPRLVLPETTFCATLEYNDVISCQTDQEKDDSGSYFLFKPDHRTRFLGVLEENGLNQIKVEEDLQKIKEVFLKTDFHFSFSALHISRKHHGFNYTYLLFADSIVIKTVEKIQNGFFATIKKGFLLTEAGFSRVAYKSSKTNGHLWGYGLLDFLRKINASYITKPIALTYSSSSRKMKSVEPLADGDIIEIITGKTMTTAQKVSICRQMIQAVKNVHRVLVKDKTIDGLTGISFKAFHGDIKIDNFLYYKREGEIEIELTDFQGAASYVFPTNCSEDYMAPELATLHSHARNLRSVKGYYYGLSPDEYRSYLQHAHSADIWGVGLCMFSVFTTQNAKIFSPCRQLLSDKKISWILSNTARHPDFEEEPHVLDAIKAALTINPHLRPDIDQLEKIFNEGICAMTQME